MRTRFVKNIASRRGGRGPRNLGEGGFALLITVTLLAFLVLLLVSLASLTRVETQVASNTQDQAKARQNALMALNIALGELQKYTGPDQRTTARSDMDAALANTTTKSGRWLGAYGNGAEADYDMAPSALATAVKNASDAAGSQAKLLNWLVSGNENTSFDPATHVGAKGNITTPPSSFQFKPDAAISGLTTSTSATNDSLKIADKNSVAQPARLMVGAQTVGNSVEDFVVAPLREISADSPGLGSAVPVGRYAWWIGDENAKARLNLPIANASQQANAFVAARRAAVELVDAVNPSASTTLSSANMLDPDGTKATYNPSDSALGKIFSTRQLSMLSTSNATVLANTGRYRYHDLSPWSVSLLADTYAGGMKRDLSYLLADITPASHASPEADTDFLFKVEPRSGSYTTNEFGVPTWGMLRRYAQQTQATGTPLPVKAPELLTVAGRTTPTVINAGLAPVMTYAVLGFHYGTRISAPLIPDTSKTGSPLSVDNVGTPLRLGAFPVVVLWNPYTADIKPALYEVGFRKRNSAVFEFQAAPAGTTSWSAANVREWKTLDGYFGSSDPYIRFLIETPTIPAGQSLVFTLKDTDIEFSQADYACRLTYGYRKLNHVLMPPAPGLAAPEISAQHMIYRVGVNGGSPWFAGAKKTLFGNNIMNFGNADYSHAYLRLIDDDLVTLPTLPPTTFPKGYLPYDSAASSPGLGVLQWLGEFRPEGQYGAMPYGQSAGYSRIGTYSCLLQEEGNIGMIYEPQFWLTFSMRFSGADTRWLAVANPRSFFSGSPAPTSSSSSAPEPPNWIGSPANNNWPPGLNVMGGVASPRAHAGVALSTTTIANPVVVPLYELRPDDQPLLSIGQLQHANLSLQSDNASYPVGNSSGVTYLPAPDRLIHQTFNSGYQGTTRLTTTLYDSSWLLNRTLWDRYFVSTIPNTGTGKSSDTSSTPIDISTPFANPRMIPYGTPSATDLRDPAKAAANLVLDGGFNINSTSEQAWRAVLAGCNRLTYDPVSRNTVSTELRAALSRFSKPLSAQPAALDNSNVWSGYRVLTPDQIALLARGIVTEIRSRGPSVSLADFTNRRLSSTAAFPQPNDSRLSGVIQAAINATATLSAPVNAATATPYANLVPSPASWTGSTLNAYKAGNGNGSIGSAVAPVSAKAAFAPQYLTQADVLSAIGPGLAARSDTFTIRAYGESLNPTAASSADPNYINGRAWCEAVVQRLPEYLDSSADPQAHSKPVSTLNQRLGRRYKVVSFRWLSANDI